MIHERSSSNDKKCESKIRIQKNKQKDRPTNQMKENHNKLTLYIQFRHDLGLSHCSRYTLEGLVRFLG